MCGCWTMSLSVKAAVFPLPSAALFDRPLFYIDIQARARSGAGCKPAVFLV
jgi:hypothetical protein